MATGNIWNASQVFLGQTLALDAGDLYILNSCQSMLATIKDEKTKGVFESVLHLWVLTVVRNDETIPEGLHGEIEKLILEKSEELTPEVLGLL
jgi:hypothetical protein